MIVGTYNAGLVVLSVLIAIIASYAAINLGERVGTSTGQRRWVWLTSGAIATGSAIWSMHYIGMLAFVLPVPVRYHVPTVLVSLFAAIAGSAVALLMVSRTRMRAIDTALVGLCLGGAIGSMHYIGMAAMRSPATHHYDRSLVTVSIVVAVTFSSIAAWLAFRLARSAEGFTWSKLAASSLMGIGIASMHYTAMAAASFAPGPAPPMQMTVKVSTLGAFGLGMTALMVLATVLTTSWIDRRLARERLLQQLYDDLERSQAYLAEAQRLTQTGSWAANVITRQGIHSSEEHSRLYGFDPDAGFPPFEQFLQRVHPEDRERLLNALAAATEAGADVDVQFRVVIPGGQVRYIHSIGHPVLKPAADAGEYFGIAMDVTERRRADEEHERLRQAEADLAHISRVTALGELGASLAHELRQPLSAAMTDARTCLRWLTREEPDLVEAGDAASRIVKGVHRAAEIVNSISALSKKAVSERTLIDMNELIRETTVLLRSEATRHSIAIRTGLAADLPRVSADRVQLQQVLMNLMLNGIDAMKQVDRSGELTVTSRREPPDQLRISVSDTGRGVPDDRAGQIFDTFFTTKPHGIGMGLSISRSIIESHGGRLWLESALGRGASFHFVLPAVRAIDREPATRG